MATVCGVCGATFASDETCSDRFDTTQGLEFANPPYFAVHHLSVPCYLLQHNHYSRAGWLAARQFLHEALHGQLGQEEARELAQATVDKRGRAWRWTSGPKLAGVNEIVWSRTISHVRFDTAAQYRADVRQWARAVLSDTAGLVQALSERE